MTLLEFFFIISWIIILILAVDISKKQRFNALHFLIFLWVWVWLLIFAFFPSFLNLIWLVFWVARWADVLVYGSIIFLLYFVLLLLAKHVENKESITSIIREFAIENSEKRIIEWEEVFLIRAYNEASVISDVLKSIIKAGYKNILVVNDWSTDKTKEIVQNFWDNIILLNHFRNRWAWAALETGFEYIRRYGKIKYIITFDADWQHDVADTNKFVHKFEQNPELWAVFGSRFIENTAKNIPLTRKIILFLGRIFTYIVSWVFLTDTHNWFRVFTLESVQKIKLTIDSMAYASELIEEIKKNDISFAEVPVTIIYTNYSLSKWQSSGNAIFIALRFIWNKFMK